MAVDFILHMRVSRTNLYYRNVGNVGTNYELVLGDKISQIVSNIVNGSGYLDVNQAIVAYIVLLAEDNDTQLVYFDALRVEMDESKFEEKDVNVSINPQPTFADYITSAMSFTKFNPNRIPPWGYLVIVCGTFFIILLVKKVRKVDKKT